MTKRFFQAHHQGDGEHRITAQVVEVVIVANAVEVEQLFPNRAKLFVQDMAERGSVGRRSRARDMPC